MNLARTAALLTIFAIAPVALSLATLPRVAVACPMMAASGHSHSDEDSGTSEKESTPGHSHEMSELHGGSATMTPRHHFESLFTPSEIRLYLYDAKQAPIADVGEARAVVTLEQKEAEPVQLDMTWMGPDPAKLRSQGYFVAQHEMTEDEAAATRAVFTIEGLAKAPVDFRTAVKLGRPAVWSCPMHPDVKSEDPTACPKCGMALESTISTKRAAEAEARRHHH